MSGPDLVCVGTGIAVMTEGGVGNLTTILPTGDKQTHKSVKKN